MDIAAVVDAAIPFGAGVTALVFAAVRGKKPAAGNPKVISARNAAILGTLLFLYGGFMLTRAVTAPPLGDKAALWAELDTQAARLNAAAPTQVAPGLVLEHATAKDGTFTYIYRFTDKTSAELGGAALEAKQREYMKTEGCKRPEFVALLDANVRVMQLYIDKDSFTVARVTMEPGFCKT